MGEPEAQALTRSDITSAIQQYLDALEGKEGRSLPDLARALDNLVATYHRTADVGPDSVDTEAPSIEEKPLIEEAATAHPDLGWYALVDPEGGPEQQVGMSMAVGDLVEIAADLHQVLWLFEHAGHNDAVWDFRFGYQSHWGRHLHEVRTYLHALYVW